MANKSQFILDKLGDFWRRFKETPDLLAYWDGQIELVNNISQHLQQINQGKGLFTVPVLERSSPVLFVLDQTTATAAVPAGYAASFKVDPEIESIPQLTTKSDGSGSVLTEGVAYSVTSPGTLSFKAIPPRLLFADNLYSNRETAYRNFGFPIDFKQPNSEVYKRQLQGLWYALWNGGAVANIRLGFSILLGLPFVQKGRVISVTANLDGSHTIVVDDQTFQLPPYLTPTVSAGQVIENFTVLSDGADVWDYLNNPTFVQNWDLEQAKKYFTFIPQVMAEVIAAIEAETGEPFDFSVVRDFLDRIRPAYTNYVIGVRSRLHDDLLVFLDSALLEFRTLLTSTVNLNYRNNLILPAFVALNGIPGSTDLERQENVKDLPEFALSDEVTACRETVTFRDITTNDILVTA